MVIDNSTTIDIRVWKLVSGLTKPGSQLLIHFTHRYYVFSLYYLDSF